MPNDYIPKKRAPKLPEVMGAARENMSVWVKERVEEVTRAYEERIENLRLGKEHPTPYIREQVRFFAMMGLEERLIAKMLQISHGVLMTHYEEDLELGYAEVVVKMAATAYKIGSDPTHKDAAKVALEVLARRGGESWKPATQKTEDVTKKEPEGKIIDSSKLTYEDRQALREMILRAEATETPEIADQSDDDEPTGE